jgi:hypothetical protein
MTEADKLIMWEWFEATDEGHFSVSKNVDAGDVMVVIKNLAKKFEIDLKVLAFASKYCVLVNDILAEE